MLSKLFAKIQSAQNKNDQAIAADARDLLVRDAKFEMGVGPAADDRPHSIEVYETLFLAQNLTDADAAATKERYKQRYRDAEIAGKLDELRTNAQQLETAAELFDRNEGERHRAALKQLQAMREKTHVAMLTADEALAARDRLFATADIENAAELKQLKMLTNRRDKLVEILAPRMHPSTASYLHPTIIDNPGALAAQTRRELDDKELRASYTPAKVVQLEKRLAAAEEALVDRNRELAKIENDIAALTAQMKSESALRMVPENFAIVRVRPTRDELAQQHAERFGFGQVDDGIALTTG